MSYTIENPGKTSWLSRTFAPLPNWLLSRKEISLTAKVIYARLLQYKGKKDHAYPGRQELADECGLDIQAADRAIQELKKFELLLVKRRGHTRANMYTFPLHEWMSGVKEYKSFPTPQGDSSDMITHTTHDLSPVTTHDLSPVTTHDLSPMMTQYEKITEKIIVEKKRDFSTSHDFKEEFEEFWSEYPLKRHKKLTSTNFIAAREVASFAEIMKKVKSYKRMMSHNNTEKFYITSHKWLDEERWNDCYGAFEKERPSPKDSLLVSPEPPEEYKDDWKMISEKLREKGGQAKHKSWFEKLFLERVEGDRAIICAASRFIKDYSAAHFQSDILCAVQSVYPAVTHVKFTVISH